MAERGRQRPEDTRGVQRRLQREKCGPMQYREPSFSLPRSVLGRTLSTSQPTDRRGWVPSQHIVSLPDVSCVWACVVALCAELTRRTNALSPD
eukprot:2375184-Prymnesium_polylepis.1